MCTGPTYLAAREVDDLKQEGVDYECLSRDEESVQIASGLHLDPPVGGRWSHVVQMEQHLLYLNEGPCRELVEKIVSHCLDRMCCRGALHVLLKEFVTLLAHSLSGRKEWA